MRSTLALLCAMGCTPPEGPPHQTEDPPDTATTPTTGTGTTTSGASTGTTTGTGTTTTGPDCTILPGLPVNFTAYEAFDTSEDFDLDGDGYMCSNHNGNLACRNFNGDTKIISPGIGSTAGIRILPDGNWVVNDVGSGALVHIDAVTGGRTTVASGINYPNGLEVSADGRWAFIGENGADKVRQIEIATGTQYIAAQGLAAPNGVILSPDEQTLYAGSFGGGVIYAVDRISETEWDNPRVLFDPGGPDGGFDGINVDICGNVYITEFTTGRIYRLTDDGGLGNGTVAELPESWIPNMRWGHDIGGWDSSTLYVSSWDAIYALDMGIAGKKHVLMP